MNGIQPWAMTLWGRVLASRIFCVLESIFCWSLDSISAKTWGYGWWGDSKKSLSPSQTDILVFTHFVSLFKNLQGIFASELIVWFTFMHDMWLLVTLMDNIYCITVNLFGLSKPETLPRWDISQHHQSDQAGLGRYFYPRTFRKSLCNFFSILIQYFLAQNICLCPRNALHKMECTVLTFYVPASPPCCCCCH